MALPGFYIYIDEIGSNRALRHRQSTAIRPSFGYGSPLLGKAASPSGEVDRLETSRYRPLPAVKRGQQIGENEGGHAPDAVWAGGKCRNIEVADSLHFPCNGNDGKGGKKQGGGGV